MAEREWGGHLTDLPIAVLIPFEKGYGFTDHHPVLYTIDVATGDEQVLVWRSGGTLTIRQLEGTVIAE